ncbi:MAG: type II toxin-antitoxin system YoeB family toxin [Desulfovibrio sp.]|nr:type II toxin-antitoxin system YoeB family toxin [Desulfovibrio sp.]
MQKAWTDEAWEDYVRWQTRDNKTLKRINAIWGPPLFSIAIRSNFSPRRIVS